MPGSASAMQRWTSPAVTGTGRRRSPVADRQRQPDLQLRAGRAVQTTPRTPTPSARGAASSDAGDARRRAPPRARPSARCRSCAGTRCCGARAASPACRAAWQGPCGSSSARTAISWWRRSVREVGDVDGERGVAALVPADESAVDPDACRGSPRRRSAAAGGRHPDGRSRSSGGTRSRGRASGRRFRWPRLSGANGTRICRSHEAMSLGCSRPDWAANSHRPVQAPPRTTLHSTARVVRMIGLPALSPEARCHRLTLPNYKR